MIRQFCILFLFLLLPLPCHAAKGHGVEVRGTLPALVDIEPGRIVSGSFLVTNTAGSDQSLLDELQLPPSWNKIVPQDRHFSLQAGKQQARLVAFSIPANAPAGEYVITYIVRGRDNPDIIDAHSFTVRVLPVRKLALALERKPERVIAGQAFLIGFRLLNLGNSADGVQLEIRTSSGFSVDPERPRTMLAAGEARSFQVMVRTDGKLQKQQRCVVTVLASAEGAQENSTSLSTSVDVLPSAPDVDLLQRAPARLRLIAAEEDGRIGMQAEFSGGGALDEAGKRRIDFLFRSPDIQEENLYGQRDEYRINFYGEHVDFLLGDQSYSLSPLTERWKYGRGGGARFHFPQLGAGAFYVQSRWQEPRESEIGTYLSYQLTDRLALKGNFLRKEGAANAVDPDLNSDLSSLEAAVQWGRVLRVAAEYGVSDNSGESLGGNQAYRTELTGDVAGTRYSFEKIYAGPQYYGYYHDVELMRGDVTVPLTMGMSSHLSFRSYRNNLDLDPAAGTALEETSYRAGIRRPFSSGMTLSLEIEDIQKEDPLPMPRFDYREIFLTAGIGQSFSMGSIQFYVDRGIIENYLAGGQGDFENYSFFASLFPSPAQTYGVYGRFGHDKYSEEPERSKSLGVSANWHLNDFRFGLNYQLNNLGDPEKRTATLISTVDVVLPNNHILNLRNRWSTYQGGREEDLSSFLAYTIPLVVPVGRKTSVGVIAGQVLDADNSGRPLANVLVTIAGFGAMTDASGSFTFPSLKPGDYYLAVENGSIGLDRVTSEKMPMKVTIKGGEKTDIEIRVTRAGRLTGQLVISSPKREETGNLDLVGAEGAGREETVSLANVSVKISRQDEAFRQMTDLEGRFSFGGLRPGNWTVTVYQENLPPYHYLEKSSFEIELQGSETKEAVVKVIPRVRKIRIVHQETGSSTPIVATASRKSETPGISVRHKAAQKASSGEAVSSPSAGEGSDVYTVHVGTYLLAGNRLQAEKTIRRFGFVPELTPIELSIEMVRLLVGEYSAKGAKKRLLEVTREAPDAFILPAGKQIAVYAGSYYNIDTARAFTKRLAQRGLLVEEQRARVPMTLSRVTFGQFSDRASAEEIAARVRSAGLEAIVIKTRGEISMDPRDV